MDGGSYSPQNAYQCARKIFPRVLNGLLKHSDALLSPAGVSASFSFAFFSVGTGRARALASVRACSRTLPSSPPRARPARLFPLFFAERAPHGSRDALPRLGVIRPGIFL